MHTRHVGTASCLSLALALCAGAPAQTADSAPTSRTLTYPDLVHRLIDLEALATLPLPGELAGQASSYDRKSAYVNGTYVNWDANSDGTGIIREENGQQVLAEVGGPGCIWRIWSAAPAGGHLKIYLDDDAKPAVDLPFGGYFDGKNAPFTYPALVYMTPRGEFQGGSNCYLPIPFQKSCRIVAEKNWGWFYHFNYTQFPPGTQVPTFRRDLSAADRSALAAVNAFFTDQVGTDPAGPRPGEQIINQHVTVAPGQTASLAELSGPGAITAFRIRGLQAAPAEQINILRELVLRMAWDGESNPSVWSPLGDFFGTAPGVNRYHTLPVGMTDDEFYAYWYMPFAKGARLEILNEGRAERSLEVSFVRAPLTHPPESLGRFHAKWHRDVLPPAEKERSIDWTLVKTEGRGRFCGTLLNVWNPRALWWGEGDEKFFVDGEKFPSTIGTGSEDYLGYAWGQPYFFERPFHALTRVGPSNRLHTSGVRWHIAENVPFQTSFEGCIEKYNKNDVPVLYSAVAYWYLSAGGQDPLGPVPLRERIDYYTTPKTHLVAGALEAEELPVLECSHGYQYYTDLSWWAKDKFSNDAGMGWTKGQPGDRLVLGFPVEEPGDYDVHAMLIKAQDYGKVQLSLDGVAAGEPIDLYNAFWVVPSEPIFLGRHYLIAGQHKLGIHILGKNPEAKGLMVGIDYLKLDRATRPEADKKTNSQ